MRILMTLACLLFGLSSVTGQALLSLAAEGVADREATARELALRDLASQIQVRVKSNSIAREYFSDDAQGGKVKTDFTSTVETFVDVPLYGVSYETLRKRGNDFVVRATLPPSSLPLYLSAMEKAKVDAQNLLRTLNSNRDSAEEEQKLLGVLTLAEEYWRLWATSLALGNTNPPQSGIDEQELRTRLLRVQQTYDTLERAAQALVKNRPNGSVYVYPPMPQDSSEVTPFGAALRDRMQASLGIAVVDPSSADYTYRGSYQKVGNDIEVVYRLSARNGKAERSAVVRVLPSAYAGLSFEPQSLDLDKLARLGYVVNNDFRVELMTNRGKTDLFFREGDRLSLLVKLSAPGYFFIVDHMVTGSEQLSVMVELNASSGLGLNDARRFIRYIGLEDVNKWVVLGEYNVVPPFAIERLQVIASTVDPVLSLPPFRFDPSSGYYVLGKPAEAIVTTRGIQLAKPASDARSETGTGSSAAAQKAEYILTITTMQR